MTWTPARPRLTTQPNRLATVDTRRVKPEPRSQDFDRLAAYGGFYQSLAWKKLKAQIFKERGHRCEDPDCKTPNRGASGWIVCDHIQEIKDGGSALDKANILCRCPACHSLKTHAVRKARNSGEPQPASTRAQSRALFDPNAPGRFTIA